MGNQFEELLNTRRTIFTASGIFTGLIVEIRDMGDKGYGYSLENVIFRPTGHIRMQVEIPECALYSDHFISTTFDIEPMTFE